MAITLTQCYPKDYKNRLLLTKPSSKRRLRRAVHRIIKRMKPVHDSELSDAKPTLCCTTR